MNENKYLKISSILLFIAFASVSCWATSESLHLLLPKWPVAMCWIVTIGFFVVASIGTKMIVDSLNQSIYLEKRVLRLIGGVLILIFFWLVCSMPTNTHTFFYRSVIDNTVSSDISQTKGYLNQIKNNTVTENQIQAKCNELEGQVISKLGELEAEIKNGLNPGFGEKSQQILRDFASLLDVPKVEPLNARAQSKQDREKLVDAYREKIYVLLRNKQENIRQSMLAANKDVYTKQATIDIENLNIVEKAIQSEDLDVNDAEDINEVNNQLNKGYATIKTYQQHVNFLSQTDQETYTANNQVTKVKSLLSVFDVWKDYLAGKYDGQGFIFWIIISILVDVAAFIFFDIAFKKREY